MSSKRRGFSVGFKFKLVLETAKDMRIHSADSLTRLGIVVAITVLYLVSTL